MSPMPSIHDERNKSNRFEIISASNNQRIKLVPFKKKKEDQAHATHQPKTRKNG
jgi:hypothetical protein